MEDSLLRRIYLLGHDMVSVLHKGDLELYFEMLEKRGTLLEELDLYKHPSEIDPDWQEIATALQEQHQVLTAALAEQEGRMQEELAGMHRYKGASRSYNQTAARPQILNENLRV